MNDSAKSSANAEPTDEERWRDLLIEALCKWNSDLDRQSTRAFVHRLSIVEVHVMYFDKRLEGFR